MRNPTPPICWLPLTSPPTSHVAATKPDAIAKLTDPPDMGLPLTCSTNRPPPLASLPTSSGATGPLTPPTTPEKQTDKHTSISSGTETSMNPPSSGLKKVLTFDGACEPQESQARREPLKKVPEEPQAYCRKYRIEAELGQGAWSNVYSAFEQSENLAPSLALPPSPPVSPESKYQDRQRKFLAVKVPSERMAHKVLKKEACILTYLHSQRRATSYLVAFHGFDISTHTIVMDAVPTSLEGLVKSTSRGELSTKTMFDPVIGAETWAGLAGHLIDGLAFLQSVGCIHGDIKPANILIRSDKVRGTLTPLYCDFSSARIHSGDTPAGEMEEITAVTKEYLSPELLVLLLGRNGDRAIATFASDVFALAVTLLAAATGESPYAAVQMEIQKLSMAKEGVPIEFARQGANGSRVMKGRAVAKILGPAVERDAEKRVAVDAWQRLVKEVLQRWKEGGWARGG